MVCHYKLIADLKILYLDAGFYKFMPKLCSCLQFTCTYMILAENFLHVHVQVQVFQLG